MKRLDHYLPVKLSYLLSHFLLDHYGKLAPSKIYKNKPLTWRGLFFPNRLGLAAGMDKKASQIKSWWALGAGFIEVGSITPKKQNKNPNMILKKNWEKMCLWNAMGFPNPGLKQVLKNLKNIKRPYKTPIFFNLGKQRETSLNEAYKDYLYLMRNLENQADAFVLNISSPNTSELRRLFEKKHFEAFLNPIMQEKKKPILLKLSPDLSTDDLKRIFEISFHQKIDGFIATNTTRNYSKDFNFPMDRGGLSGMSLKDSSIKVLKTLSHLNESLSEKFLIISTGGIFSKKDLSERLHLGADLCQIYSSLVLKSPFLFWDLSK